MISEFSKENKGKYDYYRSAVNDIERMLEDYNEELSGMNADEIVDYVTGASLLSEYTGNLAGSYTLDRAEAEENICGNLDLLRESLRAFDMHFEDIEEAETLDVIIREYVYYDVLEETVRRLVSGIQEVS